jgi:hypothetical protein
LAARAARASPQRPTASTAKPDRDSAERRISAIRTSSSITRSRTFTTCLLALRHAESGGGRPLAKPLSQHAKIMRVLSLAGPGAPVGGNNIEDGGDLDPRAIVPLQEVGPTILFPLLGSRLPLGTWGGRTGSTLSAHALSQPLLFLPGSGAWHGCRSRLRRSLIHGSLFGHLPPLSGGSLEDFPVGLRTACRRQPVAFLGPLHILLGDRHERRISNGARKAQWPLVLAHMQ